MKKERSEGLFASGLYNIIYMDFEARRRSSDT